MDIIYNLSVNLEISDFVGRYVFSIQMAIVVRSQVTADLISKMKLIENEMTVCRSIGRIKCVQ